MLEREMMLSSINYPTRNIINEIIDYFGNFDIKLLVIFGDCFGCKTYFRHPRKPVDADVVNHLKLTFPKAQNRKHIKWY